MKPWPLNCTVVNQGEMGSHFRRYLRSSYSHRRMMFLILPCLIALAGCGDGPSTSTDSGCDPKAALIAFGNGFVTNKCGCNEADGNRSFASESLSCTIALGDTVVFQSLDPSLAHQVRITKAGSGTFEIAGPKHDPANDRHNASFGYRFTEAGTYLFSDLFQPLGGQIVVP